MLASIGYAAAYTGVGIALLALGFVALDLLTPGHLGRQIYEEGSVNAGIVLSAGFLGQGAIAYRQLAAPNGPIAGPRIMLATIPEVSSPDAAKFGPPRAVDGAGDGAPAAVGPPDAPAYGS